MRKAADSKIRKSLFIAGLIAAAAVMIGGPAGRGQTVGRRTDGRIVLPVNQTLTPSGRQIDLPGQRPQALALSPDGRRLAVAGKSAEIVILDPETGAILQRVLLPPEPIGKVPPKTASANILEPDDKGQLSFTGLAYSPDGSRIYMSNVDGSIKVFAVGSGGEAKGLVSWPLPLARAPRREEEIPSGLALSPDGTRLYAVFNLSNRLGEIDTRSGKVLRTFDVGVAPFDVVLKGTKAYVSNWGGRRPGLGDVIGPAGRGTFVKVDSERMIANEGSVSVIDLRRGVVIKEILAHLHSSALALSPDRRYLVCANAASDNLSVIDTRTDEVVETIWTKPNPADLFGASPNALAFDKKGKYLFAANGTQNAVAVIRFRPGRAKSEFLGLIPVGWFPGAILHDPKRSRLIVANTKALPKETRRDKQSGGRGFNTHQYTGSLSLVTVPKPSELPELTAAVWANFHKDKIAQAFLPPRPGRAPRPIPERIGEPSVFKHVVYIIKENRTYDQVFGDLKTGNGDPSLCVFGENVTPNQHRIAQDFVLLDNTYCNGILSADGHQWSTTAFATDYLEKSFAGWARSYPDGMGEDEVDALAYAPTGFIWDNALRHGKTLRDYGEFAMPAVRWADPARKGWPDWTACWNEYRNPKGEVIFGSTAAIETLRPHLAEQTVGWNLDVPDQFRADYFIRELKAYENKGTLPDLILICLPDDHTSGASEGSPTPAASVADNDLAFGRIIEALSLSPFWKETVVFGIEDDPQNGWDHVSGYRTTAYCVSPYTKRGQVVGTFYNTVSLLRTIEQILGLPPMNQFDAAADPMTECFQDTPDFTPFRALPNNIPLDQMNPIAKKIKGPALRRDALVSAGLNFKKVDACPEDILNRILWRAQKGSAAPYPAWAVAFRPGEDDD